MRSGGWRWIVGLAIVALLAAGAYIAGSGPRGTAPADPNEADTAAYDFEASAVVVRQTDAEGRLLYRMQAAHVAQLPLEGAISADDLSMNYDPPEAPASMFTASQISWLANPASRQMRVRSSSVIRSASRAPLASSAVTERLITLSAASIFADASPSCRCVTAASSCLS